MNRYRVEIQKGKEWQFLSSHGTEDYAVINAETTSKSRKKAARVTYNKEVVYIIKPEEEK